jgi:acyl-CoA thioester hydrolase
MPRINIQLPEEFPFSCKVPIRITDINYGGHVGNDTILSIIHEARMQFFHHFNYTEMQFAGTGMIMADVAIQFKGELYYGDTVMVYVAAGEFSKVGFDLFYKLEKELEGKNKRVANAKTGMVCYDYEAKKIVSVPEEARVKLAGG